MFFIINPEAGIDYSNYVNKILPQIIAGEYFKEIGFYLYVKVMNFIGLSPETIILTFRIVILGLLLRFFYYIAPKYKLTSLLFFILVPNLSIAILSSLQTMLALSIFMQYFILKEFTNCRKLLLFSLLSFSFHYFAIIYIALYILHCIVSKYINIFFRVLLVLSFVYFVFLLQDYLFLILNYFSYLKYIDLTIVQSSTKTIVIAIIFSSVLILGYLKENNEFRKNLHINTFLLLFIFATFSILFKFESVSIMRGYNYFIPFLWIVISSIRMHILVRFIFILLILLNFINTINNINPEMLKIYNVF